MTPDQLAALNDADLEKLRLDAINEQERRHERDAIPAEIARLHARYTRTDGSQWPELSNALAAHQSRNPAK